MARSEMGWMKARSRTMATETGLGSSGGLGFQAGRICRSGGRVPGQQGERGQDIDRDVLGEEDEVDRAHTHKMPPRTKSKVHLPTAGSHLHLPPIIPA